MTKPTLHCLRSSTLSPDERNTSGTSHELFMQLSPDNPRAGNESGMDPPVFTLMAIDTACKG